MTNNNGQTNDYTNGNMLGDYVLKERLGGSQSIVFKAIRKIDSKEVVVKIFPNTSYDNKRKKMYENEVKVREMAGEKSKVLGILDKGINKNDEYIVMEFIEGGSLSELLEKNTEGFSLKEVLQVFTPIANALDELHEIGIVHRDIKPDNIFIVDGIWKIGDLGLIAERDSDEDIDEINDFIGPRGWHSPEAMNKYLCEGKKFIYSHDCTIDHQSDIFQLGKVFWYIIQNNAPTGTFKQQDCFIKKNELYCLIRTMLNYSKKKRFKSINEVIRLLKPIEYELYIAS